MLLSRNFIVSIYILLLSVAGQNSTDAPVTTKRGRIPNQYIVKLKSRSSRRATGTLETHLLQLNKIISKSKQRRSADASNEVRFQFNSVLTGYSGTFTQEVYDWIKKNPDVEKIEPNAIATGAATQYKAPWGLSRVSQREPLKSPNFEDFRYDSVAGQGVDVYVLDSGVKLDHIDFEGRARFGANFVPDSPDIDEFGHGTHVAGIVAGRTYGVAKGANIVSVKVLDKNNEGSWEGIIAGIEFAVNDKPRWGTPIKGKIINMSIQGDQMGIVDDAVNKAVDMGVLFVVCAGNFEVDACTFSPAAAEKAITVGGTDQNDLIYQYSNWGKCVDILAPGDYIESADFSSNSASIVHSGTSMAAPHVAGIAATFLSLEPSVEAAQRVTPEALFKKIQSLATKNAISKVPAGTPNLLAFSNPPSYNGLPSLHKKCSF